MKYPIKVCKFYNPRGTDMTYCKECNKCVGYCELDNGKCEIPLLFLQKQGIDNEKQISTHKFVCLKHNKSEDQLKLKLKEVFVKN